MRPLTVLTGIVLGSSAATTFGLAATLVVFLVLSGENPQFRAELPLLVRYVAVFVGTGAPRGRDLEIPGRKEAAKNIHIGIDWLSSVSFGHIDKIGKRVIVLGGGNTAMDCCRTSRRPAYRTHPEDRTLGRLLAETEAAFVEKAYRHYLPASRIPVLQRAPEGLESEQLSPEEFFLLSRIDGTWDVKSIIQISPIREVDALSSLKRMREKGLIELRDPE